MPNTHCLPSGSLASGELPVIGVPYAAVVAGPAPGSRRGIVVLLPGLNVTTGSPCPPLLADFTSGFLPVYLSTFTSNLNTDGWLTVYPPTVGFDYVTNQALGIQNLLNNDGTHGTLYKNAVLRWWDHVVNWVVQNYGTSMPIVPFGISWGGWTALSVTVGRTSTIGAYGAHVPAEPLWATNPNLVLNYVGTPSATTTVASGSNGQSLPMAGSALHVASISGFPTSGTLVVNSTTAGWQILSYTNATSTPDPQFTGCTGGNSSLGTTHLFATGDTVEVSNNSSGLDFTTNGLNTLGNGSQGVVPVGWIGWETADTFIGFSPTQTLFNQANASSKPVTSFAGTGNHQFDLPAVSKLVAKTWVSGGTYALNAIVVSAGVSYQCILAVSGSATAPASDATHWSAISGGASVQGWFPATVDPLFPATN